ncbi:MAG TPA: hypothetical protein VHS96_15980 [Bacteroidia bacterium]|nr:hypothetical protein [Bacteroidia bacterium]
MTKLKAKFELYSRLQALGFTYEEAVSLRRIEMTLQRWAEQECGDSNSYASWAIERDEETGKPFMVRHIYATPGLKGGMHKYPIADRETGALKRLRAIVAARDARYRALGGDGQNDLIPYHQTDCRGCMVYLVKRSDLDGKPIDQVYNRGLAVCC